MTETLLIEQVLPGSPTTREQIAPVDEVLLTSDERIRAHGRARSVAGRDLVISLPRGIALDDGDLLVLGEREAIAVRATVEDLLEVRPGSAREGAAVGYTIGNLHRPLRIDGDVVLTPYDSSVVDALAAVGVESIRVERPFTGERLNASPHHHGGR